MLITTAVYCCISRDQGLGLAHARAVLVGYFPPSRSGHVFDVQQLTVSTPHPRAHPVFPRVYFVCARPRTHAVSTLNRHKSRLAAIRRRSLDNPFGRSGSATGQCGSPQSQDSRQPQFPRDETGRCEKERETSRGRRTGSIDGNGGGTPETSSYWKRWKKERGRRRR